MQFVADCSQCQDKVTSITKLDDSNLDRALANDEDVEVICFPRGHTWKLDGQAKANLRKRRAQETHSKPDAQAT